MAGERSTARVLPIDGGGIRGLVPAVVLSGLQRAVGSTPLVDLFDPVAGTSTGGRIALGLTVPGPGGKPLYAPANLAALQAAAQALLDGRKDDLKQLAELL